MPSDPAKKRAQWARYTGSRLFTDEERAVIRERRKYQSATELAAVFETTPATIGAICRGVFGDGDWRERVQLDPEDQWILTTYRVAPSGATTARTRYLLARNRGRCAKGVPVHRIIMNPPPGMMVDHINGDTFDNRRCNLRVCTPAENARNSRGKGARSGYKGVFRSGRGRWAARITVSGADIGLGRFDTPEEAARAYDAKAVELHGEFAKLNFPNEPLLQREIASLHSSTDTTGEEPDHA